MTSKFIDGPSDIAVLVRTVKKDDDMTKAISFGDALAILEKLETPNSLYVHRPLANADELHAWADDAGIPNLVPPHEMHVTQVYSRTPVALEPRNDTVTAAGGDRHIAPLGDKGAVVLHFQSDALKTRHQEAMAAGASHDFPQYLTHITLSYDAGGKDLSAIAPPTFPLQFGPEVHAQINEDWAEEKGFRTAKAFNPEQARDKDGKWVAGEGLGRALGQASDDDEDSEIYHQDNHGAPLARGAIHIGGAAFASPNLATAKDLPTAIGDLSGARQAAFQKAGDEIDDELGLTIRHQIPAVGAWSDGAENSTMTEALNHDPEAIRLSAAMKGALGQQKAVLAFTGDEQGPNAMYDLTVPGQPAQVHDELLKAGVPFHTLIPSGNSTRVVIVDTDGTLEKTVGDYAVANNTQAERLLGHAEFIGDQEGSGSDAEQRARGQAAYQAVIAASPSRYQGRTASEVWQGVRDRWADRLAAIKSALGFGPALAILKRQMKD